MAARKLQTEIDRTLKKVGEGVELFESIYEKMQASTNQTQKEKLETDLKTQIKKLQRLRDQIKTWVAGNEIKDKTQLLDNRRLIETQMERFKACEKEMKTKAFSKEGLNASTKLDPKLVEKMETMQWIQEKVESLQQQVELTEAEIESLHAGGKKKKASSTTERVEALEHLNERRKWHIGRLELILRLLDNGTLKADKVKDLQEDVTYFVDSNADDEFDEDEGIYDEYRLDEHEEVWGITGENDESHASDSELASEDIPPRTPSKKHDDERETTKRDREPPASPVLKKAGVTMHPRKPSTSSEAKPPPNPNFSQAPMASVVKSGLPASRAPTLPPIRYAAAAAAAVASPVTAMSPPTATTHAASPAVSHPRPNTPPAPSIAATLPTPVEPSISGTSSHDQTSSPMLTHSSVVASPMLSTTSAYVDGSMYSARESPALSEAIPPQSPLRGVVATSDLPQVPDLSVPSTHSTSNGPPGVPAPSNRVESPDATSHLQAVQPLYLPGVTVDGAELTQPAVEERASKGVLPNSLSDLVSSLEEVKRQAPHRMSNLEHVHKVLDSSRATAPQAQDTDKARYYVPRNPWNTPTYYPQTPAPVLEQPSIFAQLEVETLFYVFYYHPGSYMQYLAAKELKKQSWRFHVKYMTWFQRHSEPQAITNEYEQGVYVYFDWEGSWCQRKKADFRFEYRYLSED